MQTTTDIAGVTVHIPPEVTRITEYDLPKMLIDYGKNWEYYIIGGHAYNLLMKIPITTLDYDIKFDYKIEDIVKIRDFIHGVLSKQYPNMKFILYDNPELSRLSVEVDKIKYDIVDLSPITFEHVNERYDLKKEYIISPVGLRYGSLSYLLKRLEELTEKRRQIAEHTDTSKTSYLRDKSIIDQLLTKLYDNPDVSDELLALLLYKSNLYGKSSESDKLLRYEIKQLLEEIADNIIEKYNMDDDDEYIQFINSPNKVSALNSLRANGLNTMNPLDAVMLLYIADDIYTLHESVTDIMADRTFKYLRTKARLDNLVAGLTAPYEYYSDFFIEQLKIKCKGKESVEMFLTKQFQCNYL